MYQWPVEVMQAHLDAPVQAFAPEEVKQVFTHAGLGQSLIDFLTPLYANFNGATFFDGAFRILPVEGFESHGFPLLMDWNSSRGWKRFEDTKANDTFYFCSNGYGDLFGIAISPEREILADRIGIYWVERYEYQEAGVQWQAFFPRMFETPDYANFFARVEQYRWAVAQRGKPAPWQCFSSNVPPVLGGPATIDNIAIQSLAVHVSFTSQLLQQWKEGKLVPGQPLAMVDLYDQQGNLIR